MKSIQKQKQKGKHAWRLKKPRDKLTGTWLAVTISLQEAISSVSYL